MPRAMMLSPEMTPFTTHGGALDAARARFPKAPEPWLDLSTGINAHPYPVRDIPEAAWARLPEAADLAALEATAAERYAAPAGAQVVAAPGTQAILQRLPVLCRGRDVRILGPTYGEFERVFRDFDRQVKIVPRLEALAGADVAVIVNPNNPDGRLVPVPDLAALAARVGALIVDEAFVDALPPSTSAVPRVAASGLIVLRSFGKMFGLAGLRLGFAVATAERAKRLRRLLGPWPVSGPALAIGRRALADEAWLAETRVQLREDGERLTYLLRQIGAVPVGGTPLFRLVSHPSAGALFARLAAAGILVRPFAAEPRRLRFGFPGRDEDWRRLEAALAAFR